MSENGSPAPIFETDEDRGYFLSRFPAHPSVPGETGKASRGHGVHEEAHEKTHDGSNARRQGLRFADVAGQRAMRLRAGQFQGLRVVKTLHSTGC